MWSHRIFQTWNSLNYFQTLEMISNQHSNVPKLVKRILTDFCSLILIAKHSRSLFRLTPNFPTLACLSACCAPLGNATRAVHAARPMMDRVCFRPRHTYRCAAPRGFATALVQSPATAAGWWTDANQTGHLKLMSSHSVSARFSGDAGGWQIVVCSVCCVV